MADPNRRINQSVQRAFSSETPSTKRPRGRPMNASTKEVFDNVRAGNYDFLGPVTPHNGFARNLKLNKILYGFQRDGGRFFLVRFYTSKDPEIVSSDDMKKYAPQELITYYSNSLCMAVPKSEQSSDCTGYKQAFNMEEHSDSNSGSGYMDTHYSGSMSDLVSSAGNPESEDEEQDI